jgi:hypothetical protein
LQARKRSVVRGRALLAFWQPFSPENWIFMTNIMSINGPEAIWLVADRRLTRVGKIVKEDARKLMILETTDGIALLGYTGLGATGLGNEPADWMSAVLRSRNMPLEPSLRELARALEEQFPQHLDEWSVDKRAHGVIIPAFLNNQPKFYWLKLEFDPHSNKYRLQLMDIADRDRCPGKEITPRLGAAGTGGDYLNRTSKFWARDLLGLINAHDRGRIRPTVVADRLAERNYDAYEHLKETKNANTKDTVGPDCIVVWRYRRKGKLQNGGGGEQCYTGTTRITRGAGIPCISNGTDMAAVVEAIASHFTRQPEAVTVGEMLRRIPLTPDERLR